MRTVVSADSLLPHPSPSFCRPFVVLEDGQIAAVGSQDDQELPAGQHLYYPGGVLAAPYFDVHVHGCCGQDVMEASPACMHTVGSFQAAHGVCAYLPTTITAPVDATLRSLSALAARIHAPAAPGVATPLGIHIEGPFLSHTRKGAHPAHNLQAPSVELLEQMWQAAEGTLRLMTIAPELAGALPVMARARELGIRISLGHSDATYGEASHAIEQGADSATHTFNAMRPFEQREPGILGAVLESSSLYAELICDGLHVHPSAVRLLLAAKGAERILLVTDAMAATGMPDGNYKLGELEVRLENGRCLIGENTLAGSTLALDQAVRNFCQFTQSSLVDATGLASRNPARMAGFADSLGTVAPGRPGNLLVLSAAGDMLAAWINGGQVNEANSGRA